jgi:hypothetical protein
MHVLKRVLVMAFLGALGAFLGAAAGEALFLKAPEAPVEAKPRDICLVFDMSSSMLDVTKEGESQLEALRRAAFGFIASDGFQGDTLSLVAFSTSASIACEPTRDGARMHAATCASGPAA